MWAFHSCVSLRQTQRYCVDEMLWVYWNPIFFILPGHPIKTKHFKGLKHISHRFAQFCNADRNEDLKYLRIEVHRTKDGGFEPECEDQAAKKTIYLGNEMFFVWWPHKKTEIWQSYGTCVNFCEDEKWGLWEVSILIMRGKWGFASKTRGKGRSDPPIEGPQTDLSAVAPDLLDILSVDAEGSHLQIDEPGDSGREIINIVKERVGFWELYPVVRQNIGKI